MKNVLEKILEEISERIEKLNMADNMCRVNAESNRNFESVKYFQSLMFATERAESIIGDIIRSHMDEVENGGWIPCSERLPEEHDSMFAKASDEVNVTTIDLEKGTRKTETDYTLDGKWHIEINNRFAKKKVIAWQPLPKEYNPVEE